MLTPTCNITYDIPKTMLSGLNIAPYGPALMASTTPGSKSTNTALGTYVPPKNNQRRKRLPGYRRWSVNATLISLSDNLNKINCIVLVYRQLRWNKHWFFRAANPSRLRRHQLRQFRARRKCLPKTASEIRNWNWTKAQSDEYTVFAEPIRTVTLYSLSLPSPSSSLSVLGYFRLGEH